jgi:cytochrome c5
MNKKRLWIFVFIVILTSLSIVQCNGSAAPTEKPAQPQPGATAPGEAAKQELVAPTTAAEQKVAPAAELDGKALLENRCTQCHSMGRIESKKLSADEWKGIVSRMVGKGANLNDAEQQAVIDYLAKKYGK